MNIFKRFAEWILSDELRGLKSDVQGLTINVHGYKKLYLDSAEELRTARQDLETMKTSLAKIQGELTKGHEAYNILNSIFGVCSREEYAHRAHIKTLKEDLANATKELARIQTEQRGD